MWRGVSVGVGKLALRERWRRYMRKRWVEERKKRRRTDIDEF